MRAAAYRIIPQALCTRFGLAIGAHLAWLVRILMLVLFPIAYPISKLLDCILGHEHGTFYRRAELKELVNLHGQTTNVTDEALTDDEIAVIRGALEMSHKTVRDSMTPLDAVFMLDSRAVLDEHVLAQVAACTLLPPPSSDRIRRRTVLMPAWCAVPIGRFARAAIAASRCTPESGPASLACCLLRPCTRTHTHVAGAQHDDHMRPALTHRLRPVAASWWIRNGLSRSRPICMRCCWTYHRRGRSTKCSMSFKRARVRCAAAESRPDRARLIGSPTPARAIQHTLRSSLIKSRSKELLRVRRQIRQQA